jgi:hypothetical protein
VLQKNQQTNLVIRKVQEAVGAELGFPSRMSMIGCIFRLVFVDLYV